METRINEIADGIYRLSTFVPDIAPPAGFTFNQFLVLGDEPLLFHTGLRKMFPLNREAAQPHHPARAAALDHLRPFRGRRMRRDERVAGGRAARRRSRTARPAAWCRSTTWPTARRACSHDGEVIDLGGGKRVRYHRHAAHAARLGRRRDVSRSRPARCCAATCSPSSATAPALTEGDIVGPAIAAEDLFKYSSLNPGMGATHPRPREARAAHAGADARPVLHGRRRRGAARAGGRLRSPHNEPPDGDCREPSSVNLAADAFASYRR